MLRRIRNQLRLIRYYSAPRRASRLSRVSDAAVLAMLLAAWPATLLADRLFVVETASTAGSGLVLEHGGRRWVEAFDARDDLPDAVDVVGRFDVTRSISRHGWPFASSERAGATSLAVTVDGRQLTEGELRADASLRHSIEVAMLDAGLHEEVRRMRHPQEVASRVDHDARAWVANGMLMSIAFPLATWLVFAVLRLAAMVVSTGRRSRRKQRADTGRCAACGYDLRGNLFGELCPECGNVV